MNTRQAKWYKTSWGILAILIFWPFIGSYMLIKYLIKSNIGGDTAVNQLTESNDSPRFSVTMTDDDERELARGMPYLPQNSKYDSSIKQHLSKLVVFYKERAAQFVSNENVAGRLAKELYPKANENTCPYCGVVHDYSASRARKCGDCGNKMIVRQGVFLEEKQAVDLDKKVSDYYEKSYLADSLKSLVESIQSYAKSGNYGDAYLHIAEAYQTCAIIYNQKYDGGYTNWDYSWGILNREALEVAGSFGVTAKDIIGNGYSDVIFARGKHCMRELKYTETQQARKKYAKIAISMFYSFLIDLRAVGLKGWNEEEAVKNIHIALQLGEINNTELKEIQAEVDKHTTTKPNSTTIKSVLKEVDDFVFLDNDESRLKQLIH